MMRSFATIPLMVSPIAGPTIREDGGTGPDNQSYYSYQKKWTQAKPFTIPLQYVRAVGRVQARLGNPPYGARRFGTQDTITSFDFTDIRNKSYDKLKGKMYDSAQMAVNLLEGRQSLAMIANRAGQLIRFGSRLRKLDFAGAARELRLAVVPRGVSVKKSFANNWLEFHFGWSPLIKDIGTAVDILQSPLKNQWVRASSSTRGTTINLQAPQDLHRSGAFNDWSDVVFYERLTITKALAAQGCSVAVSNPNLFLANQLGFVNPFTVIWELIPFSFVWDWFINVEQFLSSGTDFLGLTIQDSWNTKYLECLYEYYAYTRYRWWIDGTYYPNDQYYYTSTLNALVNKGYHVIRSQGLANPVLAVRPLKLLSWKRALTSVSLLVQQLGRRS